MSNSCLYLISVFRKVRIMVLFLWVFTFVETIQDAAFLSFLLLIIRHKTEEILLLLKVIFCQGFEIGEVLKRSIENAKYNKNGMTIYM